MEHPEELVVPVQQQLLALVLERRASVFGQKHRVSLLDRDRDDLAREGGAAAGAHGDDLALGQLFWFCFVFSSVSERERKRRKASFDTKRSSAVVVVIFLLRSIHHTHLARRGRLREQHASDRLGGSRELLHQDPEGWLDWKERGVKRECENQGGGESVRAAGTGVGEKEKKKQWKQSSSSSIWRLFSRLNPLTGPAGARVVEQRSSWLFKEENGGLVRREERCLWRRSLFFPLECLRSDEV